MKSIWLFLFISQSLTAMAMQYDVCDLSRSDNLLAQSECFEIDRPLNSPWPGETSFTLKAVMMTENLESADDKETMVLIPGGPGSDAQSLQISLNQKDLLNAFWKHLNLNVVLFDPRATGSSNFQKDAEFYPQQVFTTELAVEDLKAVIHAVSPHRPVYLFSHSAGGDTAAKLAAQYPELVKGLILYSSSIDTREIGESNLRLFSNKFEYFDQYLNQHCSVAIQNQLIGLKNQVEEFLASAVKLGKIAGVRPPQLLNLYLRNFREEMIVAAENDRDCNGAVFNTLKTWSSKIEHLPNDIIQKVKSAKSLSFNSQLHEPPVMKRGTWIRTAMICSEGITKSEIKSELWLRGLKFSDDTCHGVEANYDTPPSREWLQQIQAPTLLMGGTHDFRQTISAVRRNASMIANSKLVVFEGGGHTSHMTHTWEFYKAIEEFLNSH